MPSTTVQALRRLTAAVALVLLSHGASAQLAYTFSAAPVGFVPFSFTFEVPALLSAGDAYNVLPFSIGDGSTSWQIELASSTSLATQGSCFLFASAGISLVNGADTQCGLGTPANGAAFWFFTGATSLPAAVGTYNDWYVAVFADPSSASGGADQHGTLSITAVPEPETAAMLLAGVAALGWLQRRRSV